MKGTNSPDKIKLAELIKTAKGEDRTLRQYAADAGISPSIVSRVISGSYTPGIKVLQRLASDQAAPRGGVTLRDLLAAAGYAGGVVAASAMVAVGVGAMIDAFYAGGNKKRAATPETVKTEAIEERTQDDFREVALRYNQVQKRFRVTAMGMLDERIYELGVNTESISIQDMPDYYTRADKVLRVKNQKVEEWWLSFWTTDPDFAKYVLKTPELRAESRFQNFLLIPPNPKRQVSIITDDKEMYMAFERIKDQNSFRGNLSIVLVDVESLKICKECVIALYDDSIQEEELISVVQ